MFDFFAINDLTKSVIVITKSVIVKTYKNKACYLTFLKKYPKLMNRILSFDKI